MGLMNSVYFKIEDGEIHIDTQIHKYMGRYIYMISGYARHIHPYIGGNSRYICITCIYIHEFPGSFL